MEYSQESRDISKPKSASTLFKHDHGGSTFLPNEGKTKLRPEMAVSTVSSGRNMLNVTTASKGGGPIIATSDTSSGSIIRQELDKGHTATQDYRVMHGQPLLRGNEVADPIDEGPTHAHSFNNYSGGWSQPKADEPDVDIPVVISQASELYHALAYSYMITCLMKVKITPSIDSRSTMILYFGLGLGHFKYNDNELATSSFLKALEIAKSLRDRGNLGLIEYYLGEIEYSQNKFLAAANYFEQSIKHHAESSIGRIFKLETPSLSSLLCKQGTTLRYGSRIMESVKKFEAAIDTAQSKNDELAAHTNLGNLYQAIGDFTRSVTEYEKTIKLGTELEDYLALGWAHGNIGNAYLGLSKKEKALEHLDRALELTLKHEATPIAIGRALNNQGTAYQAVGNNNKAKEYYDESLSQAVFGADLPGQARVYGNLGNILMMQEQYIEAIAHYSETLSISRDRATQTTAYHNRGCARYERAELERKDLDVYKQSDHKYHLISDAGGDYMPLPDNILKHYRSALSDLEKVTKYHEQTLNNIKGSSTGLNLSVSLFETNSRTFQRLQDCAYCISQWKHALVYAEQSRSRTLGELILRKKGADIEHHFRTPLDLPQIVHVVKRLKLPVIFMSFTGNRLLVWLLTANQDAAPHSDMEEVMFDMFQSDFDQSQFDDKSFDYVVRFQLTTKLCDLLDMYRSCDYTSETMLNKLYEFIAKPLLQMLEKIKPKPTEVILIPDSYARLVPMSALQNPFSHMFLGDQLRFHIMNSLLITGVIYQLPSVTVTLPLDKNACCVVGNPYTRPFTWKNDFWKLGSLPFSEKEARHVAFTLGTSPIINQEASKDVVLMKIKHSKIIHLATHGCAGAGFLVFSSATEGANTSQFLLFSEDIENITTPAALVVLSSCDSARGAFKADGIQGIARSFLLAGAQTVLTSLWRVPDESACYFMHFFYCFLIDGFPSYTALQKACLSIRCYKKYSEYIHWSGYQLQGREIVVVAPKESKSGLAGIVNSKPSKFPNLDLIQKLTNNLIQNKSANNHPLLGGKAKYHQINKRDVQLLVSGPAGYPMESVIDYIIINCSHYTGGIYWIPGHTKDHVTTALEHIKENVLPSSKPAATSHYPSLESLTDFFTALTQPTLLILHQFQSVPIDIPYLHTLMNNPHVSTIMMSPISANSNLIVNTIHKILCRGCIEHEVTPLDFSQSMQRLVYFILSRHKFHPMNPQQEVLEGIQELMCGNVPVAKLCLAVLERFIKDREGIVNDGLETFSNEVINPTLTHQEKLGGIQETGNIKLDGDEGTTTHNKVKDSVVQEYEGGGGIYSGTVAQEGVDDTMGTIAHDEDKAGDTDMADHKAMAELVPTQVSSVMAESSNRRAQDKSTVIVRTVGDEVVQFPDPSLLIFTGQLLSCVPCTPPTRVLMSCLSLFNGTPFHNSILRELSLLITEYSSLSQFTDKEDTMISPLKSYHIIVPYPFPVIRPPVTMVTDSTSPNYYIMPDTISETVYLSLTSEDKKGLCVIVDRTLGRLIDRETPVLLQQRDNNQCLTSPLLTHLLGLKAAVLLQSKKGNNEGPDDKAKEVIIQQYIEERMKMRDNGPSQLVKYFVTNHSIST